MLAGPASQKITLQAGVPQVVAGSVPPITIQIPSGVTALVETTCATQAEIEAGSAPWVQWPVGSKAGPYMDQLNAKVTGIRLTSSTGGVVYLVRS